LLHGNQGLQVALSTTRRQWSSLWLSAPGGMQHCPPVPA